MVMGRRLIYFIATLERGCTQIEGIYKEAFQRVQICSLQSVKAGKISLENFPLSSSTDAPRDHLLSLLLT